MCPGDRRAILDLTMRSLLDTGSITVADVMHRGVITCSPADRLEVVARAMADHAIHCVVAIDEGPPGEDDDRLWGVISDLDLVRGIRSRETLDAGTVSVDDPLEVAADLMLQRHVAHLVVEADGRPVGVLSTLDIARALATEEET